MAANPPPELASGNPCCIAWQGKYLGMKKRRDACKEAIEILQKAMGAANDEKASLQEKLREMSDSTETKENDSVGKTALEKQVSDLKSLQQRLERNIQEKSGQIKVLRDQASSGEKEISELKNLLKKETSRADNSEEEREQVCKELNKVKALLVKYEDIKPDVPELKEEINLVKSLLVSERQKAELERKKAESEKKKADQYLSELEMLRATARKSSSDLLTLTSNLESVKKQFESEKQKTLREKKRADMESAKAKEQMKLAEGLSKKFEIIRVRNEELKKEAELQSASSKVKFAENSAKLEEKMRLLEMNKKTAMDWKSRVDDLTRQLQESHLVTEGLKKQVHELSLSRKSTRSVSPHEARDLEKAKMRLLKKELKFAKKREKHFNEVAEFEKYRRKFQAEELGRFKLEFTNRMNLLGASFSRDVEGTAALAKVEGRMKPPKNRSGEKSSDPRCHLGANPGSRDQACKFSSQLIARAGQGVSDSVSGSISQLESPNGGSRELQTSGVVSSATSFSEGELLASQGRKRFAFTTSAETAKDKPNIQPTKPGMFQKVDTRKNGNLCFVAENCVQSGQKDRHEVLNEHTRKRKRLSEAVESRKHLSSDDKKKDLQIREKLGALQSTVAETGYKPLREKETLISCEKKTIIRNSLEFNRLTKTRGNKSGSTQVAGKTMCLSTTKGHDAATLFLEDAATDYMKLLELDQPEEENYYKIARESPMSPDLPQVDFLGDEVMNEDKNTATALDLVASYSVDLCDSINSSDAPCLNTENASVTVKMPPESPTSQGHILKHFAVFSNTEDKNSIIKIFHAANNCVQRCPSVATAQWAVPAILFSLKMEDNLLSRERVCVLLSLLLHNFSMVTSINIGNTLDYNSCSCLASFSKHISSVMTDTEAEDILSEFLEELLSLLQDLLSEQRVLYSAKSSETTESDLSIPVTLDGENVALFSRVALIDHLVAGSAILAAICTVVDRVALIREASFDILHKQSHEKTPVPLTILHVFAHIAGDRMMSSDHDISTAVLKSIVMFLENTHYGTVEGDAKFHPGKNKCPFSDKSSSLEAVGSMLMEIVQELTQSHIVHQSLIEFRPAHKDFQCVLARDQSVTLYDILSLVELIACYTAWDWTSANIVSPLLKMLGMPLPMNVSVALISILGQLSRIGVDAGGYENEGISNLREKLSSFLQLETTRKAGFGVQIATVSSLLKTLQLDLAIVLQGENNKLPDCGDRSLSVSANIVTKWFSLLSDEQRAFATEFLQTSVVR